MDVPISIVTHVVRIVLVPFKVRDVPPDSILKRLRLFLLGIRCVPIANVPVEMTTFKTLMQTRNYSSKDCITVVVSRSVYQNIARNVIKRKIDN